MKRKHLLSLFIAFVMAMIGQDAIAQDDIDMAEYYFNQGQFEQARLYYDKIYKSNKTARVYTNYLNTLIALNDFEEAEKMVKKKIKTDNSDGVGYLNLGELYKRFNKNEEAKEQFDLAVSKMDPNRSNVVRLANEFARINEFQYALAVYQRGKDNAKDGYTFTYEIANMQGNLGDYASMTESFLDLIIESPNYLQTVQNSLARVLNFQENPDHVEMLKSKLLKRTQKHPDQTMYNEMLIWLFLQKKDFAMAYVQATALDKRLSENGYRLVNLAQLAASNKDYSSAKKSYQYVIDKGSTNEYYITSRLEKLQVMNAELIEKPGFDKLAYQQLSHDYSAALKDLGQKAETAIMMKELAHIDAFYLDKADSAAILLRTAIDLPGIYNKTQAICKLELGDILVFQGEIWEASLLFSQVELDFKEDPLGHEAKFRNARISYYTGDFEWAQGQLDALKASTSKLISNDAIDLSLLITDNFNMDTITAPMEMYARADLLRFQNKYDQSMVTLDSILTGYPSHSLTDEILMMKADMEFKQGHFEAARDFYQKVVDFHFTDITADDALYKLAEMNRTLFLNNAKAMELYEKLITDFPGSLYVIEARKHFRELRGDAVN